MSTNDSPRDTGHLITYAIACVLLDEIDARDLKPARVRDRSGISERSWTSYMNGHTEGVPLTQWDKVARALGMRTSEVVARAEARLDALSDGDVALLLGVGGPAAMMVMRDRGQSQAREQRGSATDPTESAEEGTRRSA